MVFLCSFQLLFLLISTFICLSKVWGVALASSFSDDGFGGSDDFDDDDYEDNYPGSFEDEDDYNALNFSAVKPGLKGLAGKLDSSAFYQKSQSWKRRLDEKKNIIMIFSGIIGPFSQRGHLGKQFQNYLLKRPPELAGLDEDELFEALPESKKKMLAPFKAAFDQMQEMKEKGGGSPDLLILSGFGSQASSPFSGPLLLIGLFFIVVLLLFVLVMMNRKKKKRSAKMWKRITRWKLKSKKRSF